MDNCIVLDDLYKLELVKQLELLTLGASDSELVQVKGIVQGTLRILDKMPTSDVLNLIIQLQKINRGV